MQGRGWGGVGGEKGEGGGGATTKGSECSPSGSILIKTDRPAGRMRAVMQVSLLLTQ